MKIFIIEDDLEIVHFLKKGFQYENYLVDIANSGEEALSKLMINKYDFIILDLLLPKMDGADLLKKIRGQGIATPLIVLSAIGDTETKIKLLQTGADDYVEKPFSLNELLARIQTIFKRSKALGQKNILQVGDLVINPSTREVLRDGRHVSLRKKEYALLEYLAQHAGEVINHNAILEHVWDFNTNTQSNTLGSHISSLRQKVDGRSQKKLIQTIHGIGYKISH